MSICLFSGTSYHSFFLSYLLDSINTQPAGAPPYPSWLASCALVCLLYTVSRNQNILYLVLRKDYNEVSASKVSLPYSLPVFVLLPCLNLLWTAVHILRHARTPIFSVQAPQVRCPTHLLQCFLLTHVSWWFDLYVYGLGLCPFKWAGPWKCCQGGCFRGIYPKAQKKIEFEDTLALRCLIYPSGQAPLRLVATFLGSYEQIGFPAKLLAYFLWSKKSNYNQRETYCWNLLAQGWMPAHKHCRLFVPIRPQSRFMAGRP